MPTTTTWRNWFAPAAWDWARASDLILRQAGSQLGKLASAPRLAIGRRIQRKLERGQLPSSRPGHQCHRVLQALSRPIFSKFCFYRHPSDEKFARHQSVRRQIPEQWWARSRSQGEAMMTNSSYVGRVGGLAVALGIGAAVASGNAVASASPSTATAGSAGEATPSATVGSAGAPDPFRPRKGRPGRRRHSPDTTHITGPALRAPAPDAAHPQSTNAGSTDRFVRPASASVVTNTIESQVGKSAQPATTTTSTSAFTLAAAHSQPVIAQAAPATLTAPVTPSINTLTDVLAAFGLAPLASNHPLAPAEPPIMWGLLSWTRRQNAETAFDQSPTTVADTIQNSLVADPADPPAWPMRSRPPPKGPVRLSRRSN